MAHRGLAGADRRIHPLAYRMWLTGEFCDPDSQAAQKYGGDILRAQALSWEQAKDARDNGSAKYVATNQQAFAETAQKVKDEDPIAYECLAGHGSSSLEAAILADLGMLLMAPFLLMAGLILIAAYIVIRFAVILAPALLTAAAFFPLRGVALAAARIVGAAIINGVLFMVCALFVIRVDTTILDPATSLPNWLKLILLGVVTVVMWYLTRPFRKLTTMISPHSFADSLNEAGLGFRRAGALFRRRQQEEEAAAREADEQTVGDPRRADHSDGRVREESRGPVTLMKVSAGPLRLEGNVGATRNLELTESDSAGLFNPDNTSSLPDELPIHNYELVGSVVSSGSGGNELLITEPSRKGLR